MKKMLKGSGLVCFILLIALTGCRTDDKRADEQPTGVSAASSTPTPAPRVGAVVEGPRFAWSDNKGQRVADVAAQSGAGTVGSTGDALGRLQKAKATLYQNNKPVATLTADQLDGDRKTRRLVAKGNAVVRVLNSSDGIPSHLTADEITWEYDTDRVTGRGNIVYTKENVIEFPATFFTADTKLEHFQSRNDSNAPVAGAL